jgi:L-lactate dehydrogenase complex protein LldE
MRTPRHGADGTTSSSAWEAAWVRQVQLFVSCMVDLFRPETAIAAVSVLERRGVSVGFPEGQTCCGQFAYNAGHWDGALSMATNLVDALSEGGTDAPIVGLSGSCVAMVRDEYPKLFSWAEDTHRPKPQAPTYEAVAARLVEFSQWLVDEPSPEAPPSEGRPVALHVGCHMRRLLKATEEPHTVLERLGCPVVDYPDAEQCCGFGGTYSMTEPELSTAMADLKLTYLAEAREAGAEALVGGDWGCLLHLQGRLARREDPFPVLHVAEVVDLHDRGALSRDAIKRAGRFVRDRD